MHKRYYLFLMIFATLSISPAYSSMNVTVIGWVERSVMNKSMEKAGYIMRGGDIQYILCSYDETKPNPMVIKLTSIDPGGSLVIPTKKSVDIMVLGTALWAIGTVITAKASNFSWKRSALLWAAIACCPSHVLHSYEKKRTKLLEEWTYLEPYVISSLQSFTATRLGHLLCRKISYEDMLQCNVPATKITKIADVSTQLKTHVPLLIIEPQDFIDKTQSFVTELQSSLAKLFRL